MHHAKTLELSNHKMISHFFYYLEILTRMIYVLHAKSFELQDQDIVQFVINVVKDMIITVPG